MYLSNSGYGLEISVSTPPTCPNCVGEWNPLDNAIYINPAYFHNANQKVNTAMHEFGHQVGFGDVYGSNCGLGSVMAQGLNSLTSLGDYDICGMNTYYNPICEAGGGEDYENHCTPLVLSFSGLPSLSGPDVPFDISGVGVMSQCGWPRRPSDGLLVLDRDGDGAISSGRELFGNSTPYAAGMDGAPTWNGFTALDFFDRTANGGNENRMIDNGDSVYPRLRVWFDWNRDGLSRPFELISLATLGIQHIRLDGQALNTVDENGNILWFGTSFEYRIGRWTRQGNVVDVIFRVR